MPEKGALPDSYISALCNNITYRCRQFSVTELKTLYIGGGTPSLLSHKQLERILTAVRTAAGLSSDAEITMEANPADITGELTAFLDDAGINRLSVGIQSVDQKVLAALGRRSDAECVEKALKLLESDWLSRGHRLSLDLIAGLPRLSDEAFERGVNRVIATGADHISLYALMIEEGTRLEKQVSEGTVEYSDEVNDRQWIKGRDMLVSSGLAQYEVSNFARPGFESRHNSSYWHMNDYLGTGAGGTGTVGSYRWTETTDICAYTHFWNSDYMNERTAGGGASCHASAPSPQSGRVRYLSAAARYEDSQPATLSFIEADDLPAEVELLDDDTREFEFLMMGFRLLEGVSGREYERRFGKELEERIGAGTGGLFKNWQQRGLARTCSTSDGDTHYALTEEGILLLNQFLEALL